ncbi:TniQ family protein [Erythrobacter colymbi]|jgi:hypothetical protein|uniref:TniQ family protein n=1 Tax=Erythrobacter colymbi TaxID=1161202 RepID=UPI000A35F50E|nr:TniQ family protein [Erythrobacter colymbi]
MSEPAWPLHPRPEDNENLRQYVERLARAYGVSFKTFCFNALNIAHEDEEARLFLKPTGEVLSRLSAGVGISIEELRTLPENGWRRFAQATADFNEWIAIPANRQKFEERFGSGL